MNVDFLTCEAEMNKNGKYFYLMVKPVGPILRIILLYSRQKNCVCFLYDRVGNLLCWAQYFLRRLFSCSRNIWTDGKYTLGQWYVH